MRLGRCGVVWLGMVLAAGIGPMPSLAGAQAGAATMADGLLAFDAGTTGARDVYVAVPATDATPVQLTTAPGDDWMPSWSPDGARIAFASSRDGNADIWVMDADGGDQTRLTTDTDNELEPVFSADGSRIAFTRWHVSGASSIPEVWVMDADGGNQSLLTCTPAPPGDPYPDRCHNASPAWSPDGTTIAVTSARRGDEEIFAVATAGDPQTDLTSAPATQEGNADWSPDGTRLVFVSDRGAGPLFTMDADGGAAAPVPGAAADATDPAWSPDGQDLAYMARTAGHWQVHVMGLDGVETAVLAMPDLEVEHPDWQPVPAAVVHRPDLWVRRSDRTGWVGDDRYAPTAQVATATVGRGHSFRFWVAIQNDGSAAEMFGLKGTGTGKGMTVTYRQGAFIITSAMVAGGYGIPALEPGAVLRTIRVDVKVTPRAVRGSTRTLTVAGRVPVGAARDLVTMRVRVS